MPEHFSFLDGASHPDELVEQAHALGIEALALTDRDGVHGMVRAHVKAKELGVRLIVGAEVTVDDAAGAAAQPSTCVLFAANRTGYANLCRLITAGRLRRPKGESRVTWPEVCERAEGLIALWGGERSLLVRDAEPRAVAGPLREAFGDRLYALAPGTGAPRRCAGKPACAGMPAAPDCPWSPPPRCSITRRRAATCRTC